MIGNLLENLDTGLRRDICISHIWTFLTVTKIYRFLSEPSVLTRTLRFLNHLYLPGAILAAVLIGVHADLIARKVCKRH